MEAGIAVILLVLGLGPTYWTAALDTLRIASLGPITRYASHSDEHFKAVFRDVGGLGNGESTGNGTNAAEGTSYMGSVPSFIERDFRSLKLLVPDGLRPELTSLRESLKVTGVNRALDVASCTIQVQNQMPELAWPKIESIARDFSLDLYRSLSADQSAADELSITMYFLREEYDRLRDSAEKALRKLKNVASSQSFTQENSDTCEGVDADTKNASQSQDIIEHDISNLVQYARMLPYGWILLAYYYDRLGNPLRALEVLDDQLEAINKPSWGKGLVSTASIQDLRNVLSVRVLAVMSDIIVRVDGNDVDRDVMDSREYKVRQDYMYFIQELLNSATAKGLIAVHEGSVCERTSTEGQWYNYIFLELVEKNNYADWAARKVRVILEERDYSSLDAIGLPFDRQKAAALADEVKRYPLDTCLKGILEAQVRRYYSAIFLETAASLRTELARWDLLRETIKSREFTEHVHEARTDWSRASEALKDWRGAEAKLLKLESQELQELIAKRSERALMWIRKAR